MLTPIIILSMAVSPPSRPAAMTMRTNAAPTLVQRQYVPVEAPPPKGFEWATFDDMEGHVAPTRSPEAQSSAQVPSASFAATVEQAPVFTPAESAPVAAAAESTTPSPTKSRFELFAVDSVLCALVVFFGTGGGSVLTRTLTLGIFANPAAAPLATTVAALSLALKLGWRLVAALALRAALRARPLTLR